MNLTKKNQNRLFNRVCVGILVPPNEDQDWFCRVCISRKQEDKKKKRKKKDKKDH